MGKKNFIDVDDKFDNYEESDEDRYLFKKNDKRKTLEKKRNRKNKVLSFEEE